MTHSTPQSIEDVVAIFGPTAIAQAKELGVHPSTIFSWKRTRCIGRENWDVITAKAAAAGYTVDANVLHRLCRTSGQLGVRKRGRPPLDAPAMEAATTS